MWTYCVKWKALTILITASAAVTFFTLHWYGASVFVLAKRPTLGLYDRHDTEEEEQADDDINPATQREAKREKRVIQTNKFDMMGSDVLVFLHIQKTGGSRFGRHLVKNLALPHPCVCSKARCCSCKCQRPNSNTVWLFSRYSLGWPCGVHADMTEHKSCVPKFLNKLEHKKRKRRYLYITNIREPVSRFLSEFRCIQRGATWISARHECNGRLPTAQELPRCYSGRNWTDVTLDAFMRCHWNLAINRQTRMLADLTLVNCYNKTGMRQVTRDQIMLQSAKVNLERLAYFGLVEYQRDSQYLFERTIGLKFIEPFEQKKATYATEALLDVGEETLREVKRLSHLDLELYKFAKELFVERVKYFRKREGQVE